MTRTEDHRGIPRFGETPNAARRRRSYSPSSKRSAEDSASRAPPSVLLRAAPGRPEKGIPEEGPSLSPADAQWPDLTRRGEGGSAPVDNTRINNKK